MYDELSYLRKKNKDLKSDLEGKLKVLKKDFDEWKTQEPPIILPDPNIYIYQSNAKEYKKLRAKKEDKDKAKEQTENKQDLIQQERPVLSKSPVQVELSFEQKLKKLAKELVELREGEEVLARWPDDGWYYRSIVKKKINEYKYQLEDSLKDTEIVNREDIISEINDSQSVFEVSI
jgi:hypothetical protein